MNLSTLQPDGSILSRTKKQMADQSIRKTVIILSLARKCCWARKIYKGDKRWTETYNFSYNIISKYGPDTWFFSNPESFSISPSPFYIFLFGKEPVLLTKLLGAVIKSLYMRNLTIPSNFSVMQQGHVPKFWLPWLDDEAPRLLSLFKMYAKATLAPKLEWPRVKQITPPISSKPFATIFLEGLLDNFLSRPAGAEVACEAASQVVSNAGGI